MTATEKIPIEPHFAISPKDAGCGPAAAHRRRQTGEWPSTGETGSGDRRTMTATAVDCHATEDRPLTPMTTDIQRSAPVSPSLSQRSVQYTEPPPAGRS